MQVLFIYLSYNLSRLFSVGVIRNETSGRWFWSM